jgi:HPr kinase/phosphorylase
MNLVHASLVSWDGIGILIRGASGSGKSQLCLLLMEEGAKLVADDQVLLESEKGMLFGSAPAVLAGKLEIRGLGIIDVDHQPEVEIKLIVDLMPSALIPRMPEPHELRVEILNHPFPRLSLDLQSTATLAKIKTSLTFFKLR